MNPGTGRPSPRHRTPSLAVESALVDAAEALLLEDGPEALTVRRIAQRAGVAPMGVYNHLGGKQGVIDALFARSFRELGALFADIDTTDATAALLEAGRRYRRFALDYPARIGVMFEKVVPDHVPSEEAMEDARAAFDGLVALVRRGIEAGVVADGDPVELAQQLWSACHGAVSLELRGVGFWADPAAGHEALMATMLRGLAPDGLRRRGAPGRSPTRPPARTRGSSGR